MKRGLGILLSVALVIAACGDDDGAVITTAAATTVPSTSGETSTTVATTTTIDTGPLADLVLYPLQDTLLDTGFHAMQYGDESHTYVVSADSLTGTDAAVDRLAAVMVEPYPATTGIATDQLLLAVWVDNWQGDIAPTGVALFSLGVAGWTAVASVEDDEIVAFLDGTTDYAARRPDGPPVLQFVVTQFDWTGAAHFIAGVAVFDFFLPDTPAAFEAQIECSLDPALVCALLSDDGVLRPGDTGDAVDQVQEWLIAIGYLSGPATGTYDAATEAAVRAFQRDYRLSRDGRAGPHTLGLLESVASGTSGILMASRYGVGPVLFGTNSYDAWVALIALLGSPVDTGWYTDACDGNQWYKSTWNGFTAIFTDRSGSAEFDGWEVTDLATVPSGLYFVGGLRPGSTWQYVHGLGATWDPGYGVFNLTAQFGYPNGRFVTAPLGADPADGAVVQRFGTGTGGFVSC